MPTLERIIIQDFRNIELQEIEFSPNVNCIFGGNGEGKTNLLDAVYYLSMTKSAFGSPDRFNFRHGRKSFSLGGEYAMSSGLRSRFSVRVGDDAQKSVKRDDKPYQRLSSHIGVLPVVLISPSDISLVSESGEERRRFANSVLSQMDAAYLSDVQNYSRLLAQRNMMLKNGTCDDVLYEALDSMMGALADRIYSKRQNFVRGLEPLVKKYYSLISGDREEVGISYESDLQKAPLENLLKESREKDFALKYTFRGVHRDDFVFTMDSHPIRRCGSQGQQKSFVVALKFAQYDLMKFSCEARPMLLMDDLFDKLDISRVQNLLKMVSGSDFGQIFLTDSNKVRLSSIMESISGDRRFIEACGGKFTTAYGDE